MNFTEMIMGTNDMQCAIIKIEEKKTSTNKAYSNITLADGLSTIEAKMWTDPRMLSFGPKDVVNCVIEKQEYNGKDSFILRSASVDLTGDYRLFLPHAPINPEVYFDEMMKIVMSIHDDDIRNITTSLLMSNRDKFVNHPAAKGMHHAFFNGLLDHTGRMLISADALSKVYDVDRDILIAATALHDIGKLDELQQDDAGAVTYSRDGEFLGHAVIAIEYINELCVSHGIDRHAEKIRMLEHCIAAHHGQLDWGAITVPHTKEAQLLHFIDNIDAKMEMFEENIDNVMPGEIGEKVFSLGCGIYRATQKY